ncbi:MAG: hypothetical protein K2K26_01660 [Muribaculaceae bacterium]|nr:hypothetical protein [Muribaculaceae bacterium]
MSKFKPSDRHSLQFDRGSVSDTDKIGNFKISLAYFDSLPMYASGFKDWQKAGLLSKALETLQGYCKRPLRQQIDGDKFTVYPSFPPPAKTRFTYPKHIPEDAEWARIHINGPAVLIGHIVGDTFYLVFLDKTHKFWLTKRATGK